MLFVRATLPTIPQPDVVSCLNTVNNVIRVQDHYLKSVQMALIFRYLSLMGKIHKQEKGRKKQK
jgi:hypothetical protein